MSARTRPSDSTAPATRFRIAITLRYVEPAVRRVLDVDGAITFAELHDAIQRAMGWNDSHLHEFRVGKLRVGFPDPDDDLRRALIDERTRRLSTTIDAVRKFEYWYDFGDDWWHDIAVRRVDADAAPAPRVVLVAGEGACPPDDCGGPPGYAELVAALADPRHPEHREMREWAGKFDPTKFDLAATKRRVARKFPARQQR